MGSLKEKIKEDEMIYEWFKNEPIDINKMKNNTERFYNVYRARAMNFYKAFLK